MKELTAEQQRVKELLIEGKTATEASRIMWDSPTKESTIRRWVKNGLLSAETETLDESDAIVSEDEDSALEVACMSSDWTVANLAKRLRAAQKTNNQLRKVQREIFDGDGKSPTQTVEDIISQLSTTLDGKFYKHIQLPVKEDSGKTVEILFSDLQIGKLSEQYNTDVAISALDYYGKEVVKIVEDCNPERIVFASLGDIIEDHLKHGVQSAISTDTGLAEQMANAIEHVWWKVLAPLIALDIPIDFIGIQGNHGSSEHKGMDMYKAGRYGYDYTIYKTWENMAKLIGANHIKFNIPEGHFTTYEIYGKLTVAEHGYGHNCTEVGLTKHKDKRATNLKRYVDRYVCGDMHHVCLYDNSNLCVNGAFFGIGFDATEYSSILGFHAVPAQVVNIHEATTGVGQSTVVDTKVIQVAKGYKQI
tara:strand:- start:2103 stop:3359 length:1257 start_codon:yes stop_codon:yes gene_type:complete